MLEKPHTVLLTSLVQYSIQPFGSKDGKVPFYLAPFRGYIHIADKGYL